MLLAGDIGGTKTVLAIYSAEGGPHAPLVEQTFPSGQYGQLEAIIKEFLDGVSLPVDCGCFGVAGPVVSGRAQITNLPWVMDEQSLAEQFGWQSATLLNDLQAVAYAVPNLRAEDLHTLNDRPALPQGNIAVIAPGTGLGEAFLTWDSGAYRAHASEGGHASFAPTTELEIELLTYLHSRKGHQHVSFERVCSGGLGIPNLYDFLRETGKAEEPDWLTAELEAAKDPTPIIFAAASNPDRPCALADQLLDLFVHILGAESGNLAVKVLATGGIYIGGGIPPRILGALETETFFNGYTNKGRFKELLASFPVHVILNSKAALVGSAARGLAVR